MMTKKRIFLIVAVVAVVAGIVLGTTWYIRRNSGLQVLSRAELAMKAGNYDKCLQLSSTYIASHPGDWRGYHVKAAALLRLGQFKDAQDVLAPAMKLPGDDPSIALLLADSYSLPAQAQMAQEETAHQPAAMNDIIRSLSQAVEVLSHIQTPDPQRQLDVQERLGMNDLRISLAQRALGRHSEEEARVARTSKLEDRAQAQAKESQAAYAEADRAAVKAVGILMAVVKTDPRRAQPAEALVDLCIMQKDEQTLSKVNQALAGDANPPAMALAKLAMYNLQQTASHAGPAETRKEIEAAAKTLDRLMEANPAATGVALARAELAMISHDTATADKIADDLLKANPGLAEARLLKGSILLQMGKAGEAGEMLGSVKTQYPRWAKAQLQYARAVLATGHDKELAMEAIRAVTRLEPDNEDARSLMAVSLMQAGFYDQALEDARASYEAHPTNPQVLELYVKLCRLSGKPDTAKKILDGMAGDSQASPESLLAAAQGYVALGDEAQARQVAEKLVQTVGDSPRYRLASASALMLLERYSQVETLLKQELAEDPNQPGAHFQLGRYYEITGRLLEALGEYRAAAKLAPGEAGYPLAVAQSLFRLGQLAECKAILASMNETNTESQLLLRRVELMLGESPEPGNAALAPRQQAGLPLAQAYLQSGQARQCVDVCQAELKKTPDNADARWLLGRAYLALGQKDQCLEQWRALVTAKSDQLDLYQQIAEVLFTSSSPQEIERALSQIPSARPDLVDFVIGQVQTRLGDNAAAAQAFAKVIARPNVPQYLLCRSHLLHAQAQAKAGQSDAATAELDQLATDATWHNEAMLAKAAVLSEANHIEPAKAVLDELRNAATASRDTEMLRTLAMAYLKANQAPAALDVCEALEKLTPQEAGAYLLHANVLLETGKTHDALPLLEKAHSLQSADYRISIALARACDQDQQPAAALQALDHVLEQPGEAASAAILEKGAMLSRWGLHKQALECFQSLANQGLAANTLVRLSTAKELAAVGQMDAARKLLNEIPNYAPQYISARLMLADMADSPENAMKILVELDQVRPGLLEVAISQIALLQTSGKPDKAVELFNAKMGTLSPSALPEGVARQMIDCMLAAKDQPQAAKLAMRRAQQARSPRWTAIAVLLNMDTPDDAVGQLLGAPEQAGVVEGMLGLSLAVGRSDAQAAKSWGDRVQGLLQKPAGQSVAPHFRLLAHLASGQRDAAAQDLADLKPMDTLGGWAGAELIAQPASPQAQAEAAALLKASLAQDAHLDSLARQWALQVVTARPTCQWAAGLLAQTKPDAATLTSVLGLLQPADCPTAKLIRARTLMDQRQYEQAAALLKDASAQAKDDATIQINQAMATEQAGKLPEALDLYVRVWQATQDRQAGNNAAYVASLLYGDQPAKLEQAQKWITSVLQAGAPAPNYLDTQGWIALQRGQKDQACACLHQAIKNAPGSCEIHYHLGAALAANQQASLARWHLQAAVDLAQAAQAAGKPLSAADERAAQAARKDLDKLPPEEHATSKPAI